MRFADDLFGQVIECGEVLHCRRAAETGLAEGTPVVVGGGDCQLGMIGVGAMSPARLAFWW